MTDAARPVTKMSGALRIARFRGIDVHVHWSWAIVGAFEVLKRSDAYTSLAWNIAEYVTLFAIVLLHEFGHAFACRSVGGTAENILLWPLGGVAFVQPPQRPGAQLWSIAAGPLVNLVLLPIAFAGYIAAKSFAPDGNVEHFALTLTVINGVLFVFNILPIYPLDGGQILRSVLWYFVGPHKSLVAAAGIGVVGAIVIGGIAIWTGDIWLGVLAFFGANVAWRQFRLSRNRVLAATLERRVGFACTSCGEGPPVTDAWRCAACTKHFDVFACAGQCPACSRVESSAVCVYCGVNALVTSYGTLPTTIVPTAPDASVPAFDATPPAAPQ
ncbi:MAG: site-2 protease family protein [Planctomycetes bacterium]|nr:site-2 protease family protein [Planctomycetota bacterium]